MEEIEYIYDYDKDDESTTGPHGPTITTPITKGGGDRKDDDIMKVLIKGMFMSASKNVGKGRYENCFPFDRTVAPISRDSRLTGEPKYIIYQELANILGQQKYNIVTKMTETAIKSLDNKEKQMIASCFKNYKK